MTHGAGAVSSSGGGGGGFSAGYSTPIYHGGRRGSRDDDCESGAGCCFLCIAVGYLVAFLLCITSMKSRTRVALVWFYCILGAGLGGGLISRHYSTQDISASPTDMREVTGISFVFCQSLSIISTVAMATYIFDDQKPVVNTSYHFDYEYSTSTSISVDNYEYWGYYLLRDSVVNIESCPDESGLELYIIKSKNNLNKWISDPSCDDCYERHEYIPRCASKRYFTKYSFTATESDDYYIMFIFNNMYVMPPTYVQINFKLKRTRYDFSKGMPTLICYDEKNCNIPLVISNEYFVFDVPRDSPYDVDVTIVCEARAYVYVILFGLLPIMIGVVVTLVIFKRAQKRERETRNRSESQVFSISVTDPEYGVNSFSNQVAQAASPPKYMEHPPSYEQLYGTQ